MLTPFRFCQQPTAKAVGYWQRRKLLPRNLKSDKLL
jgi:hypothetical protein